MITLLHLLLMLLLFLAPEPEARVLRDLPYAQRASSPQSLTTLDVYIPAGRANDRPLLVWIHGGGWAIGDKRGVQFKPRWANDNGWVFVSVNYRLSPDVLYPAHAEDVSAAIAYTIEHARRWGADPSRVVVMGHSAGAQLAAIVGCEESLLGAHGLEPSDLSGVVLLDGAGYGLPDQMRSPLLTGRTREMFEQAFGDDPGVWEIASPILQAAPGDDLPPLLAVHAGQRVRSRTQSIALARAWRASGAEARVHHAAGKDHAGINRQLGRAGDEDTPLIEAFIRSALGGPAAPEPP